MRHLLLLFLMALCTPVDALAQGTILIVRHAERADGAPAAMATTDPHLSPAGHERAAALARMLSDAKIGAIVVSEFQRTSETAAPLATALGLTPLVVPANDTPALVAALKRLNTNALVVGHSNTVPALLKSLGLSPVPIAEGDYDNLFIVTTGEQPTLVRLHYR